MSLLLRHFAQQERMVGRLEQERTVAMPDPSTSVVSAFALQGMLPGPLRLLLDVNTNTVIALRFEGTALASSHAAFSLTPSAARILHCLLQAYPAVCSHQSLLFALYPSPRSPEATHVWERDLALRPIRRALATLVPVLRLLGIAVASLRGRGYILVEADNPKRLDPSSR